MNKNMKILVKLNTISDDVIFLYPKNTDSDKRMFSAINARETAPRNAYKDMFRDLKSLTGI